MRRARQSTGSGAGTLRYTFLPADDVDGGHAPRVVVDHAAHGQITLTFANTKTHAGDGVDCANESEREAAYVDCSRTESTRASSARTSKDKAMRTASHEHVLPRIAGVYVHVGGNVNVRAAGSVSEVPYASALAGCHPSD